MLRYDYAEFFSTIFVKAFFETFFMVGLTSLISAIVGMLLAVLFYLTKPGGLKPNRVLYEVSNTIVNVIRSFPFLILMVSIIPLTRLIVGTSIGSVAALVPLSIVGCCFFARLFETSFTMVNPETIEAAQAMGASNSQIIRRVIIPESMPSLIQSVTTGIIGVLSTSAAAGAIGAGGLGALALMYGYQNFDSVVMYGTVIVLIVIVQLLQLGGNVMSRAKPRIKKID